MIKSVVALRPTGRLGLALLLMATFAAVVLGDTPAGAKKKAKSPTFLAVVQAPALGDVSAGFVALRSSKGDRSKPPKVKIANAKSLPANLTVYTGVGRATKTVGTYLAPYIIVNRVSASPKSTARAAQTGPLAVGMAFVQFQKALKGTIYNAGNILQSNAPVQQTFLNLCQQKKGDINFKGAMAYLKDQPVLGYTAGGLNPVGFKQDVKKGDCLAAYGKLKKAPCKPKVSARAFAAEIGCAAPQGGGTTGINTTVGTPTVTGINTVVGPPVITGGP